MNKYLKFSLILMVIASGLNARSNKTHDLSRPYGVNLAMEYTTWNEFLQTKVTKDQFGARFQFTPFYQESDSCKNFGSYFGVNGKHKFVVGYNNDEAIRDTYDVDSRYIFHDSGETPANRKATIEYEPKQEAYGLRIDYFQCLSRWTFKGLHFLASFPIVHVENNMRLHIKDLENITKEQAYDFYKGKFTGFNNTTNAQKELHHAKIHDEKSTTQLADIDLTLAYRFVETPEYHIGLDLGFTIPTSNKTKGNWVFEPMGGNGDHWAFGGGLDFRINLWTKKDQNVKFETTIRYKYLFENHEKRTIQIKNISYMEDTGEVCIPTEYSQYFLLAKLGQENQPLIPAANILNRNVNVTPRGQVDAIFTFAYNNGGFRSELGLNVFWKDCEKIFLRESWENGQYYLAKPEFDVTQKFEAANGYVINKENIDVTVASTPAQIAALKFYGGLGYIFKKWKHPLLLGAAAHYEWADQKNGGIQNWGIWGKFGFGF